MPKVPFEGQGPDAARRTGRWLVDPQDVRWGQGTPRWRLVRQSAREERTAWPREQGTRPAASRRWGASGRGHSP